MAEARKAAVLLPCPAMHKVSLSLAVERRETDLPFAVSLNSASEKPGTAGQFLGDGPPSPGSTDFQWLSLLMLDRAL